MNMIKNMLVINIMFAVLWMTFALPLHASTSDISNEICTAYAENWQGLKYHYPKGKTDFLKKCLSVSTSKNIVENLWAIRSLIPDGHAGFFIRNKDKRSAKAYPIMFKYSAQNDQIRIGAVYDKKYKHLKNKIVTSINGESALAVVTKRAKKDPQSTKLSSLEFAARTLTINNYRKSYPNFPSTLNLVFEDGSRANLIPIKTSKIRKANPNAIITNLLPSIWGDLAISSDKAFCENQYEIAKVIDYKEKRWLWWHPKNTGTQQISDAFACYIKLSKNIDGIILDLRDTIGGTFDAPVIISMVLGGNKSLEYKISSSKGIITTSSVSSDPFVSNLKETENGYLGDAIIDSANYNLNIPVWNGPVIMITNGICKSGCDILAYMMKKRANLCSYGSPTAGAFTSPTKHRINKDIKIKIPCLEMLDKDGNRLEGNPIIPKHKSTGSVYDAINACHGTGGK